MNFKNMISELLVAGLTQASIGKSIGLSQPSVVDLLNGKTKSPRWEVGDSLIRLHKRVMRKHKRKPA